MVKNNVQKVKFCPKCGSTEIFWASGLPQLWSIWECKECGYRGAFVVEDSKLAEKIRKAFLEKKNEEKSKHSTKLSE